MILALGRLRQEDCSEFQVKSGLQSETLPLKKRGGEYQIIETNKKNNYIRKSQLVMVCDPRPQPGPALLTRRWGTGVALVLIP